MTRRMCLGLCSGLFLTAWGIAPPHARAQQAPDEIRIARSIERLGSPSFDLRSAARDELLASGRESRAALEAAAQSGPAEIRAQAVDLLRTLKVRDLWEPATLSLAAHDETASAVLARLSAQTGNELLQGDQYGSFHEANVTFDGTPRTFWQALDEICRQSGNHVRPHYDTARPGLVVVTGAPGRFPVAYAGPVRAQLTSARRVFMEDLDYETLRTETTHTFQLNLQVMWEDRLRLVAYRSPPEVVELRAGGRAYPAASQPAGSGWNVTGPGNRKLSLDLRLHPPATVEGRLDALRLSWEVIAVGDMAAIDVTDLSKPGPHRQDDLELRIETFESRPNGRYEATVNVVRELVVPEPAEVLLQENKLELYDGQGRPYRVHGQTSALVEGMAKLTVTFGPPADESEPAFLRLAYPRIRSQNRLAIDFADVPLPAGKPE